MKIREIVTFIGGDIRFAYTGRSEPTAGFQDVRNRRSEQLDDQRCTVFLHSCFLDHSRRDPTSSLFHPGKRWLRTRSREVGNCDLEEYTSEGVYKKKENHQGVVVDITSKERGRQSLRHCSIKLTCSPLLWSPTVCLHLRTNVSRLRLTEK